MLDDGPCPNTTRSRLTSTSAGKKRGTSTKISNTARVTAASACFAAAGFMLVRSWNPLGNGYWSGYRDSPDGLYVTMAVIGVSLAAIFLTSGLLLLSRRFRVYGGFALLAFAAIAASVLPYILFKWTSVPETWPWAFLIQDWIGWLRFEPRPRSDGIAIQIGLAFVVAAGLAAQLVVWRNEESGSRRPLRVT